jgi:hypothetical protein
MRTEQFLEHHGIERNPFADEDAQTDPVFKQHCIGVTRHPSWDKVYGAPDDPATSIVFGEKGSGKTAMKLQIVQQLAEYNRQNPERRVYVIEYDDFNPFLDRFRDRMRLGRRRADKALKHWKLWDHMDAILTIGVTSLADQLLETNKSDDGAARGIDPDLAGQLDRYQARDLLLLAACYDQSVSDTFLGRWHRLRKRLKYWTILAQWDFGLGIAVTVGIVVLMIALAIGGHFGWLKPVWLYALGLAAGWSPWLWRAGKNLRRAWSVVRRQRVGNREVNPLRRILMQFSPSELTSQPLPNKDRTDDRYELLHKFQAIIKAFGFQGIVVLVDRVDEPHLINGSADLMRALVWPLLDNKFLKQPDIGLKMMLPIELSAFVDRENREFYERARLDKQNMIPALEWTSEALYDLANARIQACAAEGRKPSLADLLDETVDRTRLMTVLDSLRVPRHLFKFLYRLLVDHCNAHTDDAPVWRIDVSRFESVYAVYSRQQSAHDRGLGAG